MSSSSRSRDRDQALSQAIGTLAWALDQLDIQTYGLIGGGATFILSRQADLRTRYTEDLDLIVHPANGITADSLSTALCVDTRLKDYFTSKRDGYIDKPHVVVYIRNVKHEFPVEIFDYQVWPQRQQYYNLTLPDNQPDIVEVEGQTTSILSPAWLLRQKILALAQRQNKRRSDMADIINLATIISDSGLGIEITESDEIEALREVLATRGAPDLAPAILCEDVYPTVWTWDAQNNDYYKIDENRKLVWGKDYRE